MNYRSQLCCAHAAAIWSLLIGFGLFVMPGWLPPLSPSPAPDQIAAVFPTDTVSRVGFAIAAFTAPFFVLFFVVMRQQMKRIEGPSQIWGDLNMAGAIIGTLAVQIPAFLWLAISYRKGLSPDLIAVLNDVSWFMLLGATGPAVLQNLSIGICILGIDREQKVYPRWLGYWNLWLAFTLLPGVLLPFFKIGPFAYDGLFGFWLVALGFFAWVGLNYIYTLKAVIQQHNNEHSLSTA